MAPTEQSDGLHNGPGPSSGSRTKSGVRQRHSPPEPNSVSEARPQKRARKAINCEPCRNSKLKCDRNRPCSSCVLRNTTATCYQDGRASDGQADLRGDEQQFIRVDPAQEIARLRHSINQLELHVFPHLRPQNPNSIRTLSQSRRNSEAMMHMNQLKTEPIDIDITDSEKHQDTTAPSVQVQGGLYAGPTSVALHLLSAAADPSMTSSASDSTSPSRPQSPSQLPPGYSTQPLVPSEVEGTSSQTVEYDHDLLADLPVLPIINALLNHYFSYCNWIYRHVNQPLFMASWENFREGKARNDHRMVVATLGTLLAVSVSFLPPVDWSIGLSSDQQRDWPVLAEVKFDELPSVLATRYFSIGTQSLNRHRQWLETEGKSLGLGRGYSLDLVELLLLRTHYLTLSKREGEEIWAIRGELITIGMAMGLHRDPGKQWKMMSHRELEKKSEKERARERERMERERDVCERRRWAWWHIILLERWQAFMFGRPLSVASHHFDTQLPSYCPPSVDPTGRLYEPNIALFRLAWILGDIMDSAVSIRSEPYSTILQHDRALSTWFDRLPVELILDEYQVARNLTSKETDKRRLGVQSVVVRNSCYHIRFTLHRPYATSIQNKGKSPFKSTFSQQSLDIAVKAASDLITLVSHSRSLGSGLPNRSGGPSLASYSFPGHLNWGMFHAFSGAMFFSFQLIFNPNQPGAQLFRTNIRRTVDILADSLWDDTASKGYEILQALEPLYLETCLDALSDNEREKERNRILSVVKKLAFPYHDSNDPRRMRLENSPQTSSGHGVGSPGDYAILGSPSDVVNSQVTPYDRGGHFPPRGLTQDHIPSSQLYNAYTPHTMSSYPMPHHASAHSASISPTFSSPHAPSQPYAVPQPQPPVFSTHTTGYDIWGAGIGLESSEWTNFMAGLQRNSHPSE